MGKGREVEKGRRNEVAISNPFRFSGDACAIDVQSQTAEVSSNHATHFSRPCLRTVFSDLHGRPVLEQPVERGTYGAACNCTGATYRTSSATPTPAPPHLSA